MLIIPASVSAYYLTLEAPSEIRVGEPVNVTGTTNVPPPDRIDIVFSQSINIPVEVSRKSCEITEKGDNTFNATFDTSGLEKGNYKIEAMSQTQRDFSAGSKNLRVVKLIDRSDIIRFSSPSYQEFEGVLLIEARIQDYDDNAIQMEVKKGEKTIFGPESVPVSRSLVTYELPIEEPGHYSVVFNDYKGYIGTYPVQVGEETQEKPATDPVVTETENPKPTPTDEPTSEPTRTNPIASDKPSAQDPAGTDTPELKSTIQEPSATHPKAGSETLSTTQQVSRDSPGYFLVTVKKAPVTLITSDNEDWVMEYKLNEDGAGVKINDQMKAAAEKVTITEDISEIFLKVYPYNYKTGSEVTITASNAAQIQLSDTAARAFGAPPRYGSQGGAAAGKSPSPVFALFAGLIGAALLVTRRR